MDNHSFSSAPPDNLFLEIRPQHIAERRPPDKVQTYVSKVQPKFCGRLIKELAAVLPLRLSEDLANEKRQGAASSKNDGGSGTCSDFGVSLGHLKRVRRPVIVAEEKASPGPDKVEENPGEVACTSKKEVDVSSDVTKGDEMEKDDTASPSPSQSPQKCKKRQRRSRGGMSTSNSSNKGDDVVTPLLEVVLHTTSHIDSILSSATPQADNLRRVVAQYDLHLTKRMLPGRPAKSQDELDEWNTRVSAEYEGKGWWPTVFFHKRSEEYQEEELRLSDEEVEMMRSGVELAMNDAREGRKMHLKYRKSSGDCGSLPGGAVIIDPTNGKVVSTANDERKMQAEELASILAQAQRESGSKGHIPFSNFPDEANILCTPVLLAIQGVSRRERAAAAEQGMDSNEFMTGQYLCTGYDVYLTKEPGVFEAMAMVHSRVRRVVFVIVDTEGGGLGGTGSSTAVHDLPGTNHHYRAFRCNQKAVSLAKIFKDCEDLELA